MRRFKKIIEPKFVLSTTAATLISALWCTLANALPQINGSLYYAIGFFLATISFVLLQILVATTICSETIEAINTNHIRDGIVPPSMHDSVHYELTKLLKESRDEIGKVKIICYGTSGYGTLLQNIDEEYLDIQWEIMVCASNAVFQSSESDKKKIDDIVSDLEELANVRIYRAKFLPTLRSCIVYGKNQKPIWSCLQTYSYKKSKRTFPSAIYKNNYALVGRIENGLLESNVKIIEDEFKRLQIG